MPPEHLAKVGGEGLEGGAGWHASLRSTIRQMINGECLPGSSEANVLGRRAKRIEQFVGIGLAAQWCVLGPCLARLYCNGSGEDPNAAHTGRQIVGNVFYLQGREKTG